MGGAPHTGLPLGIAQFIETMNMGGAEQLAVSIAGELAARGHRSHLVVATEPGPLSARIPPTVTVHYLGFQRASVLNPPAFAASVAHGFGRLAGIVGRERLDVVQTHLPGANFWGLLLALRGACGVVATVHNNEEFRYGPHDSALLRAARRTAYGLIVRHCRVAAVSPAVRDSLVRQLHLHGRTADRISVVTNAVPAPTPLDPVDRAALRARCGVADGDVLLLAAGRFCEQKNFGDLVAAAGLLAQQGAPFRLVIAGDGEQRPDLQERVTAAGLRERVLLPGNLGDLDRLMVAADAFAMSSLWEGLPLVLLEAMAAGLPVAAYAIDGVTELVDEGVTGLTAPVGEAPALAAALGRLVDDAALRTRLGAAGAGMIAARFSFARLADDLVDLYRTALRR